MKTIALSCNTLIRISPVKQWDTPHYGERISECRISAFWLHSGFHHTFGSAATAGQRAPKTPGIVAAARAITGFSPTKAQAMDGIGKHLHSDRKFLHSESIFCILHSGLKLNPMQNNRLRDISECKMQNAIRFCILAQPAPALTSSQNAECRNSYYYVRNCRGRYRAPAVTELREYRRSVPGGLSWS